MENDRGLEQGELNLIFNREDRNYFQDYWNRDGDLRIPYRDCS